MGAEIPIWVGGLLKWISGVTKKTTCDDVVKAVIASSECPNGYDQDHQEYTIVERWRKVERPLDGKSRILKVWKTWGDEQCNVRLMMKKVPPDSPRESRSHRKRHSRGSKIARTQTWHPRKLRSEDLEKCPEAVQRVLEVLRTQGETLANQRLRLQEKDKEIEFYENKIHMMRMEEIGANYVQETYLGEAESNMNATDEALDEAIELYEKLLDVCRRIEREEASIADLSAKIRQTVSLKESYAAEQDAVLSESDDKIAEEIKRTREQIKELVKTSEKQRVTLAQNDAALRECERVLGERKRYLRHTEVEMDHADQEFGRLQRNLEALRCQLVETEVKSVIPSGKKSEQAADSNSDTGISSLHSSSDEGTYVLDTLV